MPSNFYGSAEEVLLFECGPRVAYCYDEIFAIEGRMLKAYPEMRWNGNRQLSWHPDGWASVVY
jgi:hypothetical protein